VDNIIFVNHGGLGDNLQFSTLPEGFKLEKGQDTYIHVNSEFRNPEIYELVWGSNPYVLGRSDLPPNAGSPRHGPPTQNIGIKGWEELHGITPNDGYPKIYKKIEKYDGYDDVILVDVSCKTHYQSGSYSEGIINKELNKLKEIYFNKKLIAVKISENIANTSNYYSYKHEFEEIKINNLIHYYDLMGSVFGTITIHSGAYVMASTIKNMYRPNMNNVCIIPKKDYHIGSIYCYDNAEYVYV
jgi:hypothetical protein